MTTTDAPGRARPDAKKLLNKVLEVTLYFWVIKILCTTVGETAATFSTSIGVNPLTVTHACRGAATCATLVAWTLRTRSWTRFSMP